MLIKKIQKNYENFNPLRLLFLALILCQSCPASQMLKDNAELKRERMAKLQILEEENRIKRCLRHKEYSETNMSDLVYARVALFISAIMISVPCYITMFKMGITENDWNCAGATVFLFFPTFLFMFVLASFLGAQDEALSFVFHMDTDC